jgi:hypothetical protein
MIWRGLALAALLAPALPVQAGGDLPWGIDQPQVVAALLRQPVPAEDGFGRGFNHTGLTILWRDCAACETVSVQHDLPPGRSFADTMARKVDLDGDGTREVLLVEQETSGAAVSVWGMSGRLASTGPVAPMATIAGVEDFDSDGRAEIAFIADPHGAAPVAVFLRLEQGRLVEIARAAGFTNHAFGAGVLRGGPRDCGTGPELVLARAGLAVAAALRLEGEGRISATDLGGLTGFRSLSRYQKCAAQPLPMPENPAPSP